MSLPPRPAARPRPALAPSAPVPGRAPGGPEHEFSDDQKEAFRVLAASLSFVGVSLMLFGVVAAFFCAGSMYAGYGGAGAALLVVTLVFVPTAWWTMSAGRSLSSMVTTRGRDVERLMQAVGDLRRLFGMTRVAIIVAAMALVGVAALIVWCTSVGDKGGRCPAAWW